MYDKTINYFKTLLQMRLSREVSKIPLCVIDTADRLWVRQNWMPSTTACFVNDHPNRYSVISSCDNTHLFEKNITQIQNEWKYCKKFSSLIKMNIVIILYIIMSHVYHGSHFSARNRKLSTFFNDVCIDVVHFLLPVLSIKSMSIFWSLTYIFQKCYLCFMNTPYLSFIRQQLCKHGICSNLSKIIKIISSIAQNKNDYNIECDIALIEIFSYTEFSY